MSISTSVLGPCPRCGDRAVFLTAGRFDCFACDWGMPAPWNSLAWRTARRAYLGGIDTLRRGEARSRDPWRQLAYRNSMAAFRRTLALLRMQRRGERLSA